jgi:virginiamycin A acetyltransferase
MMIKYKGNSYSDGPIIQEFRNNDAELIIGKYCSIAANLRVFLGGNHRTDWISTFAFPEFFGFGHAPGQPYTKGDVVIGNDVWIGDSVTIMSGVTIGHGAVIGAKSVVVSDIDPYAIAAGNPARVRKFRFAAGEIKDLLELAWWDWPVEKVIGAHTILQSGYLNKLFEFAELHK